MEDADFLDIAPVKPVLFVPFPPLPPLTCGPETGHVAVWTEHQMRGYAAHYARLIIREINYRETLDGHS